MAARVSARAVPDVFEGRTWVFGAANIDTDVIMPSVAFGLPVEQQARHLFAPIRPGWSEQVRDGDILVAGRNFGTGSSRPAALPFKSLGLQAVIAESMSGLFLRNCVNHALLPIECKGVLDIAREGDTLVVNLVEGTVHLKDEPDQVRTFVPLPPRVLSIIAAGGLEAELRQKGLLVAD